MRRLGAHRLDVCSRRESARRARPSCPLSIRHLRRAEHCAAGTPGTLRASANRSACATSLLTVRRRQDGVALAMLVPGLAATIALAGASRGALLDHASSGHVAVAAASVEHRRPRRLVQLWFARQCLSVAGSKLALRRSRIWRTSRSRVRFGVAPAAVGAGGTAPGHPNRLGVRMGAVSAKRSYQSG